MWRLANRLTPCFAPSLLSCWRLHFWRLHFWRRADKMAEFIRTSKGGLYLAHKGFLYNKTGKHHESWYWRCATYPDCSTRATTTGEPPDPPVIKKVGKHDHAPDQDKIAAKKIVNAMKSTAAEHPEMLPANIIRTGLSNVGDEVLPKLPERPALKRALNRRRQAEHPRNPQTLSEVREIPDEYRKTLSGECRVYLFA